MSSNQQATLDIQSIGARMARRREPQIMSQRLADELRRIRAISGVSLRDVENATKVSNAYLSQLETGKTSNPSPQVLHTLAGFYNVPYASLIEAAGYLETQ